jgi:sigma-B regulation protein RsbU (phosphoserine phosphatase)
MAGRGLGLKPALPGSWEVREGRLQRGDWLVLYSDGLTEAMNLEGELYGLERFRERLGVCRAGGSVQAACDELFLDVAGFESQDRDDRTLFILARS